MSRDVRRVPLDFDWPLNKVWSGFLSPEQLHEDPCPACKNGYSPQAERLHNLWYGQIPFRPEDNGSVPLTPTTPAVRAFAERNVTRSPEFYGRGEAAIVREATRLATLWNGQWCHHLNQADVDALVAGNRLWDFTRTWTAEDGWQPKDPPVTPTAAQVNEWSLSGFGHDSLNAGIVIRARCEREGLPLQCSTCDGHASLERYPGQRAEAEQWQPTDPPTGDGWQLWESTTEGSPISPVFVTAAELADWMATTGEAADVGTAARFIEAGWAPTFAGVGGVVQSGVDWVGSEQ